MLLSEREKEIRILHLVREKGAVSRQEISDRLSLNNSTVSILVVRMIKEKLLQEKGRGTSRGGRKPSLLQLNPSQAYFIGLDMEAVALRGMVSDFAFQKLAYIKKDISPQETRSSILKKIISLLNELIEKSGIDRGKISGIGIGAPGLIDPDTGVVISHALMPHWENVPLKDVLYAECHLPIFVENNTRTRLLAEKWFGVGKEAQNIICIDVRSGIGTGILVNGQMYKGASNSAGEIAHVCVDKNGPLCACGRRGCLEAVASELSILKTASRIKRKKVDIEEFWQELEAGNKKWEELLQRAGRYLGLVVAQLIDFFNPELIIVEGRLIRREDTFIEEIRKTAKENALSLPYQKVRILPSTLGEEGGCLGSAAWVWKENYGGGRV